MIASRGLALRAALLAAVGIVATAGCGDDTGLARRYPVSGKVTYKGQPVEKGKISFIPEVADGRAASSQIENGKFSMTTLATNDGAIPGKYKVTVAAEDVDDSEMRKIAKGGQFHHDKAYAKAVKTARSLVPKRYSLAATSGLEREVAARNNDFEFDLTD